MPTVAGLSLLDLARHPSQQYDKIRWRVFRQARDFEEIAREFSIALQPSWFVEHMIGSPLTKAIKLGLRTCDCARLSCECVTLFPGSIDSKKASVAVGANKLPRATACVSSQPGCGVGCPFCATGKLGFRGNLGVEHILEQVYLCANLARKHAHRLRNVVFMGMGEPLHNLETLLQVLEHLVDQRTFGLVPRHLTVSTAGVPQAMITLAQAFPDVRLALSLHAASPELRKVLVPRAVSDLALLRNTILRLNEIQRQPTWLELVLFEDLNDSLEHAHDLLEFCNGLRVEVNLIPYNATSTEGPPGLSFRPSPRKRREAFAEVLREADVRCTIRTSFGSSNDAACGQLACNK